jgi:hypothetical protein
MDHAAHGVFEQGRFLDRFEILALDGVHGVGQNATVGRFLDALVAEQGYESDGRE